MSDFWKQEMQKNSATNANTNIVFIINREVNEWNNNESSLTLTNNFMKQWFLISTKMQLMSVCERQMDKETESGIDDMIPKILTLLVI